MKQSGCYHADKFFLMLAVHPGQSLVPVSPLLDFLSQAAGELPTATPLEAYYYGAQVG